MDYKCKKCGSKNLFTENGNATGLYCQKCGTFRNDLAKMNYIATIVELPDGHIITCASR